MDHGVLVAKSFTKNKMHDSFIYILKSQSVGGEKEMSPAFMYIKTLDI